MAQVNLQQLLEAGTHFGHQTKRWNPKMKRHILCARNGIYIIDLNSTVRMLDRFLTTVEKEVKRGGKLLFVGTKDQVKDCIREEATRCNMPYVTDRWLGGMLTNFKTIRQSVGKLEKIEKMEEDGSLEGLTKKERLGLLKTKAKLEQVLSGVRHMRKLPNIVFVVDVIKEHIAVAEARRLRLPIGAIVDTNCDPEAVDFPIPGNDDAIKSVQLIARAVADTVVEAAGEVQAAQMEKAASAAETAEQPQETAEVAGEEEVEEEAATGEEEEGATRRHRVVRRRMATPNK
ncbi:MAG: 30S ribosomal protein S2 [Chitinivibrionales bacterium]|nr:30S ribosomal protein S2 [Chitinivibrionales bacterium]